MKSSQKGKKLTKYLQLLLLIIFVKECLTTLYLLNYFSSSKFFPYFESEFEKFIHDIKRYHFSYLRSRATLNKRG